LLNKLIYHRKRILSTAFAGAYFHGFFLLTENEILSSIIEYYSTNVKTAKAFSLAQSDSKVAQILNLEAKRQANTINLIASENHASRAVLEAQKSVLTDKYAEGYPGHRYYGGCVYIDEIENLAIERAKKLFKAEHANVQAHSGSQANMLRGQFFRQVV
jgi:hypothetical protein